MADKSKIEWTDATWNPVTGCTQISEGCEHCYAKRHAERFRGRFGYPADNPFRVTFHDDRLEQPLRWKRPRKIFVCSMGDLFHEDVPDAWINAVWSIMAQASQHIFMVLTKRPERMCGWVQARIKDGTTWREGVTRIPLPNLWLGVTAENQRTADERIPILLQTPAAVRFVSVEPMLGPVDLEHLPSVSGIGRCLDSLSNAGAEYSDIPAKIDWVICGGESGPGASPMNPEWARSLRDQCVNAGVSFFFKQWGEWESVEQPGKSVFLRRLEANQCVSKGGENTYTLHTRVGKKAAGRLLDGREWNEWPEGRQ